ncbi:MULTISPECIES: cytochrome c biogenesis protein ResB [Streptomycetaceae]|uniref:Putative cytochrome c biogenesis membrane protein n=1 Tax=Streptantibioticus cattleyicolor (strain ATCC 35852 / DSM 46488 / JCM 4925 / NBRC 14057 / NRRL 8057) TaxID=1003195 RepID=F8JWL5_STREN|nr:MULTISPECIES: cytochrome c biogenesis protein ResB [Streptomycetaceae]AEW95802.1 putative cytochrome c biogenesis membrane protein [Streptantibioticus cattleyicolor NRRL 8057 = DSM 46488]MYS60345.1 cytochrome c biogenesis protein ResB [Streptomyces sp. SID5468]CCB76141.1 Cytochrome C biogenesis membrane protein [Streptantibioticus cattleyicolor NRRL 8057 = DSM 46488]
MRSTGTGGGASQVTEAADASAESAAEAISTAPREEEPGAGEVTMPKLGVIGWVRWMWRQLTSMRVALILLFLLSLAAIPGSLVPQESSDPVKVNDFLAKHTTLGPIYDKLGLFHVYGSVWFSAIYILLFVSLAGCIVPRSWQFVGQLRSAPPRAPRKLDRMPAYATWTTEADPDEVLQAARKALRGRRYRVAPENGDSVAAERGYLREAGNLLFHIALFGLLIAFAVGTLWKSDGNKLVVQGGGFTDNLTQFDDFRHGALFDPGDLAPFGFKLDAFHATYAPSGPNRGTPRTFRADVTYSGADGVPHRTSVRVNEPLEIEGNKVYVTGHGYAPVVTVRDGRGDVAYKGPVPFLTMGDGGITSQGVIKVPDAFGKDGRKDQLGFSGLFTPTFALDAKNGPHSSFPALDFPVLVLTAYHGDLGMDAGLPQNVYQLDTAGKRLTQFKQANGEPLRQFLRPGDTMALPGGAGSLTFDRIDQWANFEIVHQPGNGLALASAVCMLAGLAGSLFIQRRRVWVRARQDDDGRTVVELAGLGRSESPKLGEELAVLVDRVHAAAPTAPEPPPPPAGPEEPLPTKDRSDKEHA